MICWSCQADNPSSAAFCFHCGSQLAPDPATEAPCRSCRAPLPLDARFCGNCGTAEPVAPAIALPVDELPSPGGLADMLEPAGSDTRFGTAPPLAPEPSPEADAAALAYDHEEDDEATVLRGQLEEAPMIEAQPMMEARPGLKSRDRLHTEPAKVAVARTLAERLGRSGDSPGAYSKQGPSLRKPDAKGKPPPPPVIGGKAAVTGVVRPGGAPAPVRKADTERSLPRADPPARPLADAEAKPKLAGLGSKIPPVPGVAARPAAARPAAGARPTAPPSMPPTRGAPAASSPAKPRSTTEPQKVVFASPRPSEVAEILAAPEGWPDITDELAEVRFSALQGLDDGVRAEIGALRIKYPGHPEVETLVSELGVDDALSFEDSLELPVGVPRRTKPPMQPAPGPELTAIDGPPPLGRFAGTTAPPEPERPAGSSRVGAPRPAPMENFDELDDLDDPDAGESMTDLTLVERLDLEMLGVRDADDLDDADSHDIYVADDLDEPDEPDFVDRTMMVPSLQAPAPYDAAPPSGPAPSSSTPATRRPAAERRATLAPEVRVAVDERRRSTLAPGSSLLDDDERSTTLPPGGYRFEPDEPPTLAGLDDPTPVPAVGRATLVPELRGPPPTPAPFSGSAPVPEGGMTAPNRDADTAAASGQFRVSDLRLDDMPDLATGQPPVLVDLDAERTEEGTMITRAPLPPAPYGQDGAPLPVAPVRLVMLGARGEAVAERRIELGSFLDLGRQPGDPWAEDRRMEPLHARLFPAPGGVVVDDFGLPSGVYTQILDTIAVEDGDEFKVGQARLALQRVIGRGWGLLTVVRHDAPAPQTILLDRDEIIIGRDEGDITMPNDTFVSGDHCRFIREGNAVYLEDLGSSNGTYIRVRAGQCVAFGGLLLVGHTQFKVQPG